MQPYITIRLDFRGREPENYIESTRTMSIFNIFALFGGFLVNFQKLHGLSPTFGRETVVFLILLTNLSLLIIVADVLLHFAYQFGEFVSIGANLLLLANLPIICQSFANHCLLLGDD